MLVELFVTGGQIQLHIRVSSLNGGDALGAADDVHHNDVLAAVLLEKINEMGTTVLVVTHEKELVNAFNKRVITIDSGNMVSDGMEGYYA